MIIYFTGTGNSRYVAQAVACELDDELIDARPYIRDSALLQLHSERPWIIVAPTYCWRLPRVFEDLLRHSSLSGVRQVYFMMSCGTDTGNAEHYLKKLCRDKDWDYMGLFPICMPENYIAMFDVPDETLSAKLIRIGGKSARKAARRIRDGVPFKPVPVGISGKLHSGPVNPLFYQLFVKDRAFFATDACIGCGKCVQACMLQNIVLKAGKPVWQGNCTHCMACICGCPCQAIEYGKKSLCKRRYQCGEFGTD